MEKLSGYHGVILEVDLTSGKVDKKPLSPEDAWRFVGGRGLGMKLLWDRLKKPGLNSLSPENPLIFMSGPFSGLPVPSASRACVVTKSPHTSPLKSKYKFASTISYANVGGFIGPEIRFAGYDGIVISGKSSSPVYLVIEDDRVELREAKKFWGMKTDEFDRKLTEELGDRRFKTCYIGPAGENLVEYAAILHTAARAAGRGGVGCVMGSKNLKAIAIRGTRVPPVADHKRFVTLLEEARQGFKGAPLTESWRRYGTASSIVTSSDAGSQAVKNYREGTFPEAAQISGVAAEKRIWVRDFACFCCPLACKKSGAVRSGPYAGLVHDGPEYETGTMLGANLLISDLEGLMKAIYDVDDYGLDQISTGNVLGFLMEAYEKGYIDSAFLDGLDLKWGDVPSTIQMIGKIARREGVGDLASKGVRALAEKIGQDSSKFAIHVKGHELAAWNVHVSTSRAVCYATANRGACHLNGGNPRAQNNTAMNDCTGLCSFAQGGFRPGLLRELLSSITGEEWTDEDYAKTGERVYNLEKAMNYREGFRREDDNLPDRFFEEPLTVGPKKGAVLNRDEFLKIMDNYYKERSWDIKTSKPGLEKLKSLGLEFVLKEIGS